MGYRLGAYALGYVDDLRDPIEVVRPDLKHVQTLGDVDQSRKRLKKQAAEFLGRGSAAK
jgi:hypothetical protein